MVQVIYKDKSFHNFYEIGDRVIFIRGEKIENGENIFSRFKIGEVGVISKINFHSNTKTMNSTLI